MEFLNREYLNKGVYFNMALTYLLQIGFDQAKTLTDENIESVEKNTPDNSIISSTLNVYIMRTARKIANEVSEVQLLQWVIVNKPYDTKGIKKAK